MSAAAVLDRLLEPLTDLFTPEVAQQIANLHADSVTQDRLAQLAAKANEGELTSEESDEYRAYVDAIDMIGILQAKARATVSKHRRA